MLATGVDHTAAALRSIARGHGRELTVLGPGLLELVGDQAAAFLVEARGSLSVVEADEVRCLQVGATVDGAALLAAALRAPSLRTAGARLEHAGLLALLDDEQAAFHSLYQPIVELAGERVIGHEALLRATDPRGAAVLPDVLFPAAEAAGWTHVLDRIGRTTALRDAGSWLADGLLFINFVPTSIYRPQVCLRTTEKACAEAGLDLGQLVFEVTEGYRVADVDHLAAVFRHYRERGCKVALDDLGAGFSSLNLLVRLQPDVVKLDREIVQGLAEPAGAAVASAIVSMTHAYGGLVLAECIETPEQALAARELGIDLGQGWHFGRPAGPPAARARRRATPAGAAPRRSGAAQPLKRSASATISSVVEVGTR